MPTTRKKHNEPFVPGIITALLGIGLLSQIVTACGSADEEPTASSSQSSVFAPVPSTAPPIAAAPPAAPAAGCDPAPADLVDQVNGHLAANGESLIDTFVVTGIDGYVYVGGNIVEGDTKVSSADVWVAQDGFVLHALSGSAREHTPLADGRNLGLSAGDEYGQAVQDCVIAAERARNSGGN